MKYKDLCERMESGEPITLDDLEAVEDNDCLIEQQEAEDWLLLADVRYAVERIEWFNSTHLTIKDMTDLARLDFTILKCEQCGAKEYFGKPKDWNNYQGVWGKEGFVAVVEGNINGAPIQATLCDNCLQQILRVLGV